VSLIEAAYMAFRFFYHYDRSNAAVHCAEVRYSPITFRLAEAISGYSTVMAAEHDDLMEVLNHVGLYEEDPGR
jgi:hypothetical protein